MHDMADNTDRSAGEQCAGRPVAALQISSTPMRQAGIKGIMQAVPHEVQGGHHQHDGYVGKEWQVRGVKDAVALFAQHPYHSDVGFSARRPGGESYSEAVWQQKRGPVPATDAAGKSFICSRDGRLPTRLRVCVWVPSCLEISVTKWLQQNAVDFRKFNLVGR